MSVLCHPVTLPYSPESNQQTAAAAFEQLVGFHLIQLLDIVAEDGWIGSPDLGLQDDYGRAAAIAVGIMVGAGVERATDVSYAVHREGHSEGAVLDIGLGHAALTIAISHA